MYILFNNFLFSRKETSESRRTRDITLIAIIAKVNNALLLNRKKMKTEKFLGKIRIVLRDSDYSPNHRRSKYKKSLLAALLFMDFCKAFDSLPKGKMEQILLAYSIPKEILTFISKVGDRSGGRPEGSLFNSYYTEMKGRALLHFLDGFTLPLIRTL